MKTIILGDIHGRDIWKKVIKQEKDFDRVIFIGDYFDTHEDISAVVQIHNFKEIIEFKKSIDKEVVLLIGNHDHHYFSAVGDTGTSGYQRAAAPNITQVIEENKEHLQMAYEFDHYLFTHAGVSRTFLDSIGDEGYFLISKQINDAWENNPRVFIFNGRWSATGDDICQTPIWIRPKSLIEDSNNLSPGWDIIQIVGHTQVKKIDIEGKATGGKYYFIDTFGSSKEYLIINKNKIKSKKVI